MKIGAQGYTVREYARDEAGVAQCFERLAGIGFKSMQYSGMAAVSAEKLRDMAQKHNMEIAITHSNPERILSDTEALIAEHKVFGCDRIGIGAMPLKYWGSAEGVRAFIKDFTPAAKIMARHGMRLHYHNHAFEYERIGGETLFDILTNETSPELFAFIPDTFWIQAGGRCPARQLDMLRGRVEVAHFKDYAIVNNERKMAPVLEGNLCWDEIVTACNNTGVTHAMIEQDDCNGRDPFDCLSASLANLRREGYADD